VISPEIRNFRCDFSNGPGWLHRAATHHGAVVAARALPGGGLAVDVTFLSADWRE
jgi:hypothetical protein